MNRKRVHPSHSTPNNLIDNQSNDQPPNKRQRIMDNSTETKYTIPKVTTYNMRKNKESILNPDLNPLINIHKIEPVHHIIESLRLYSKIKKICIGKESRTLKNIYITSQSSTAGLCSKHINFGIQTKDKKYELPAFQFCVMNYNCDCNINNNSNQKNIQFPTFKINSEHQILVSNSNFPSTLISVSVNNEIVGYFFVKQVAASNLKRMAQPSTFTQFRMSISQNIKLKSDKYNLEININSITSNNNTNNINEEFGIGVGYYFNGRNNSVLDLICCFTNTNNTQFTISTDQKTASKIDNIQCRMHTEESSNGIILFTYNKQKTKKYNNNNNCNNNYNNKPHLTRVPMPITIPTPINTTPITQQNNHNNLTNQHITNINNIQNRSLNMQQQFIQSNINGTNFPNVISNLFNIIIINNILNNQ